MNNLLSFASVMKSIGGVLLAIVILLAMVTIHEFGHYLAGKILGFKINEFSVGFGPALFKKRSKKTGELFAVRVIPLGGYCAFDGEDEDDEPQKPASAEQQNDPSQTTEGVFEDMNPESAESSEPKTKPLETPVEEKKEEYPEPKGERFNDQPPWKRIIVLIAGATMNYLLALVLIVVMFACLGRPVFKITKFEPNKDFKTETAIEVYENGLQTGDIILEINGEKMYLSTDYLDLLDGKKKGDEVKILVLRNNKKTTIKLALIEDVNVVNMSDSNSIFFPLGIAYREEIKLEDGTTELKMINGGMIETDNVRAGFWETIGTSFAYSFKLSGVVLRSLGELFTGKLGVEAMGGPITTISSTAKVASDSLFSFLYIASFIGVNLAVFNLLPIPALDGCKVIFCVIEWIRRKPVNRKVEAVIHFAGIILLFGFAILVDLLHLF
ncbi:MAG: site-2 protease family protein [Clostridia bacterium]|nr:site-2 protease family protein [Clostridia bacterium]